MKKFKALLFLLCFALILTSCVDNKNAYSTSNTHNEYSVEPTVSFNISPSSVPIRTLAPENTEDKQTVTVYITETGKKYHREGCQYLSKSCIAISLDKAKAEGYTPCSKCHPPQ